MKKSFKLILTIFCIIIFIIIICITVSNVSKIIKEGKQIDSIQITDFPKLQYYVGEEASYEGLTISVVLKNGSIEYIKYSEENSELFVFSGFNSSKKVENQKIMVEYNGINTFYYIVVKEIPKIPPVLTNIKIAVLPKTQYKVGEWLNTDGGIIIKEYTDGTTENTIIINQYISGWEEAVAGGVGTYTLTITYKEGGILKKTTYEITISE